MSKGKILIVEDEALAANTLKEILEMNGYDVVDICSKGAEAIKSAIHYKPDLIFMDIMLKDGISGSEAALEISTLIDTKIIFLTAYYDDEMAEYAVASKAASYITKPYNTNQILANIKIALKESMFKEPKNLIKLNYNFSYNIQEQKLYQNDVEVEIKTKTQKLLSELVKHIDNAVTYKQLIRAVYGNDAKQTALRTFISRFNKKIGVTLIENVSGIGYKISSKRI